MFYFLVKAMKGMKTRQMRLTSMCNSTLTFPKVHEIDVQ